MNAEKPNESVSKMKSIFDLDEDSESDDNSVSSKIDVKNTKSPTTKEDAQSSSDAHAKGKRSSASSTSSRSASPAVPVIEAPLRRGRSATGSRESSPFASSSESNLPVKKRKRNSVGTTSTPNPVSGNRKSFLGYISPKREVDSCDDNSKLDTISEAPGDTQAETHMNLFNSESIVNKTSPVQSAAPSHELNGEPSKQNMKTYLNKVLSEESDEEFTGFDAEASAPGNTSEDFTGFDNEPTTSSHVTPKLVESQQVSNSLNKDCTSKKNNATTPTLSPPQPPSTGNEGVSIKKEKEDECEVDSVANLGEVIMPESSSPTDWDMTEYYASSKIRVEDVYTDSENEQHSEPGLLQTLLKKDLFNKQKRERKKGKSSISLLITF